MDTEQMKTIAEGHQRISDRIRSLHAAGYSRGDIAKFLNRRYQQVRNVIVDDERRRKRDSSSQSCQAVERDHISKSVMIHIGASGEIIVPAVMLDRVGLAAGDELFAIEREGEIALIPRPIMVARLRETVSQTSPEMLPLVDAMAGGSA